MPRVVLTLFAALLGPGQLVWAQKEPKNPLVVTNVTVIDCTGAAAKPDMTVVVDSGRITALGKSNKIVVPTDAYVINASGKFMIPGLWDMHVHTRDYTPPLFVAHGVTGVRVMAGTDSHLRSRDAVREGRRLDHNRVVASGVFGDESAGRGIGKVSIATPAEARLAVRSAKDAGYDLIKIGSYLKKELYVTVAEEAKKLDMPFAGHVPYSVSAEFASDIGQRSVEHLTGVDVDCSKSRDELRQQQSSAKKFAEILPVLRQATRTYDPATAKGLFSSFATNKTFHCPTLISWEWNGRADDPKLLHDARLKYLPEAVFDGWHRERAQFLRFNDSRLYKASFQQSLKVISEMHLAGVMILAGSDSPNPYCIPGSSLHDELELLVDAGLSPMVALQSATQNAAVYLGRSDVGTIETGNVADLVLLDSDPLADIANTRTIAGVMLRGRWVNKQTVERMLNESRLTAQVENFGGSWERDYTKIGQPVSQVSFANTQINHESLSVVAEFIHLRRLNLFNTNTADADLKQVGTIGSLTELFLQRTKTGNSGLAHLRPLEKLSMLYLGRTRIDDDGLKHVKDFKQLTVLALGHTGIGDQGLKHLRNLRHLRHLFLAGTKVTDDGIRQLENLHELETLTLVDTQVTDESLGVLRRLNGLKELRIAGTKVTEAGAASLRAIRPQIKISR